MANAREKFIGWVGSFNYAGTRLTHSCKMVKDNLIWEEDYSGDEFSREVYVNDNGQVVLVVEPACGYGMFESRKDKHVILNEEQVEFIVLNSGWDWAKFLVVVSYGDIKVSFTVEFQYNEDDYSWEQDYDDEEEEEEEEYEDYYAEMASYIPC